MKEGETPIVIDYEEPTKTPNDQPSFWLLKIERIWQEDENGVKISYL